MRDPSFPRASVAGRVRPSSFMAGCHGEFWWRRDAEGRAWWRCWPFRGKPSWDPPAAGNRAGGTGLPGGSPHVRMWHRSVVIKGGCGICAAARWLGCWLGASQPGACFRGIRSPRAHPPPTFPPSLHPASCHLPSPKSHYPAVLPFCLPAVLSRRHPIFLSSCPPTFPSAHLPILPTSYLPTFLLSCRPALWPPCCFAFLPSSPPPPLPSFLPS